MSFINLFKTAITDIGFKQSVGIQVSRILYVASLVWHGLAAVVGLGFGLFLGVSTLMPHQGLRYSIILEDWVSDTVGGNPIGLVYILATLIFVPIVTALGVLVSRYVFEWYNAVIHTAENTKRQA